MKFKTIYQCQKCGQQTPKWAGQCPACGEWNTLAEEVIKPESKAAPKNKSLTDFTSEITPLTQGAALKEERYPSGVKEFDRLLSGGLVKGQLILLAGAPGIGKSTLMLQIAGALSKDKKVLYVSGEESIPQISARAKRLNCGGENILLLSETNTENVIAAVDKTAPDVLIIDSIQTLYHPQFSSSAGTIGQVRENAGEILRLAKPKGISVFILGHVTKDGALAGPKVLEHMVDTVLYFDTEKDSLLRLIRAHKNRFGATSEVALFKMTAKGLEDVEDASAYFAQTSRAQSLVGRAFSVSLEGARPILTEVQALVSPTHFPYPRRIATGMDLNRCQMLLAALEKHVSLNLDTKDVYVSLAGGVKINDPALDLAVCAAVISSARDIALPAASAFIGEVGILGQVAPAGAMERRIEEARRLAMSKIHTAKTNNKTAAKGGDIIEVQDLLSLAAKLR
ncbi:MAG: DNA repair protein RadA [Elusimicrobiota bacterium]|jgi:DNA repair protein RadA/Sms|nr:DNA repair protein RadA [Elusimicrobiota bacterium]